MDVRHLVNVQPLRGTVSLESQGTFRQQSIKEGKQNTVSGCTIAPAS